MILNVPLIDVYLLVSLLNVCLFFFISHYMYYLHSCITLEQESQVCVEVAIPQRYHRAVMGPKGCRIQHITREHEVQIKFPERDENAAGQKHDKLKCGSSSSNTILQGFMCCLNLENTKTGKAAAKL